MAAFPPARRNLTELVADVFRHERRFHAKIFQAHRNQCLEDLADIHLRDAQIPMRVALNFVQ